MGEVAAAPRWQTQFFIVCLGTIGASLAIRPFTRQATLLYLESLLSADELERALISIDFWFCIGLTLSPLLLLVKFGFYTVLIRAASSALGLKGGFGETFTVIVWSSIAIVFEGLFTCLVLWIRGIDAVRTVRDLEVPLGLNLLIPSRNPAVFGLLGSINPFELWFVALLGIGMSHVYSISMWRGFLISMPLWMSAVVVQSTVRLFSC